MDDLPYAADSSERIEYRDLVLPGLALRIGKRSKTFYLIRMSASGFMKRRMGRFPGMGVERARALAETWLRNDVRTRTRAHTQQLATTPDSANAELLTTQEAADLTKMSTAWYERKRWEGLGPPYYRRGRTVRYVKHELLAWWLAQRTG